MHCAGHAVEQQILAVDELIAGVVWDGVHAGVHADGVTRARLDAESTEDAAELVDDELHRIALVAAALVALGVLAGLDVDALRRARGRTAEAGDATGRAVDAMNWIVLLAMLALPLWLIVGMFTKSSFVSRRNEVRARARKALAAHA